MSFLLPHSDNEVKIMLVVVPVVLLMIYLFNSYKLGQHHSPNHRITMIAAAAAIPIIILLAILFWNV